ncbi:hypothetical protein ASG28_06630 [Frigoribacterium sp. Leaf415]|nr:hypothetical protein ASF07_06630 [Frigoribacterium sp. Leaf254]KQT39346.1 hypothetical protein ASG28_06630 [Frigoribacterium sp. Leaf415]
MRYLMSDACISTHFRITVTAIAIDDNYRAIFLTPRCHSIDSFDPKRYFSILDSEPIQQGAGVESLVRGEAEDRTGALGNPVPLGIRNENGDFLGVNQNPLHELIYGRMATAAS